MHTQWKEARARVLSCVIRQLLEIYGEMLVNCNTRTSVDRGSCHHDQRCVRVAARGVIRTSDIRGEFLCDLSVRTTVGHFQSSVPPEEMVQDLTAYISKDHDSAVARGGFGEIWKCIYHADWGQVNVRLQMLSISTRQVDPLSRLQ